jgi:hypothetical protein
MEATMKIEVLDKAAIPLLEDMEQRHLLSLEREETTREKHPARTYRGAMTKQDIGEIEHQLHELRSAWV